MICFCVFAITNLCTVVTMSVSGFKQVAAHAILDFDRKKTLKAYCKLEGLSFRRMWKLEQIKLREKEAAIRHGTWKSRLSCVRFSDDPIPAPKKAYPHSTRRFQSGRFTVTVAVAMC